MTKYTDERHAVQSATEITGTQAPVLICGHGTHCRSASKGTLEMITKMMMNKMSVISGPRFDGLRASMTCCSLTKDPSQAIRQHSGTTSHCCGTAFMTNWTRLRSACLLHHVRCRGHGVPPVSTSLREGQGRVA